jgi:hypothetical protein
MLTDLNRFCYCYCSGETTVNFGSSVYVPEGSELVARLCAKAVTMFTPMVRLPTSPLDVRYLLVHMNMRPSSSRARYSDAQTPRQMQTPVRSASSFVPFHHTAYPSYPDLYIFHGIYRPEPIPSFAFSLAQPHPPKQQYNNREEPDPNLPPNPRLLRHAQHAIHSAFYLVSRVFELVVHLLGEGGRVADFVADEVCELKSVGEPSSSEASEKSRKRRRAYILEHLNLRRQHADMLIILTLQLIQHSRRILPS